MVAFGSWFQHKGNKLGHRVYRLVTGYPLHIGSRLRAYYVMRELKNLPKDEILLDAGCGEGVYSIGTALRGAKVVGFDLRKDAFCDALKVIQNVKLRVDFLSSDICNLPFRDACFDGALCIDVLEHVENDQKAIREIFRILKRKGTLILHVPCKTQFRYFQNKDPISLEEYGHARKGYTVNSLAKLLCDNGFRVLKDQQTFKFFGSFAWEIHKILGFRWSIFPLLYPIARLDVISNRFGNGILIVAKKCQAQV